MTASHSGGDLSGVQPAGLKTRSARRSIGWPLPGKNADGDGLVAEEGDALLERKLAALEADAASAGAPSKPSQEREHERETFVVSFARLALPADTYRTGKGKARPRASEAVRRAVRSSERRL